MLRGRALALVCAAQLAASATAQAASPAAMLAQLLKSSMQRGYHRSYPGLRLATVSCALAANEQSAACTARFTIRSQHLIGVFAVHATINRAAGGVHTKTLSVRCRDAESGARIVC